MFLKYQKNKFNLSNFRNHSIQFSIDSEEVFSGESESSLYIKDIPSLQNSF